MDLDIYLVRLNSSAKNNFYLERFLPPKIIIIQNALNTNMPRHKPTRDRTGCVRKKPLREEQEQYRHNHGLCTIDVTLRQCFQVQMTSADHASTTICSNIADLLTASTMVNDNNVRHTLLQEASVLRAMQQETIVPLEQYYFQQEAFL